MLLLVGINLFTSRVILRELGVDDYGIYNVVGGIIVILSFLNSAMASGTQRFMNVEMGKKDWNALNKVFSTSLQIHVIFALFILIIAETAGLWFLNFKMNIPEERIIAANCVYQFSILSAISGMFIVPYNASIVSHEKMSTFAYISIFEATMKLFVAFIIIWFPFDKLIFYAFLVFLSCISSGIIYVIFCIKNFKECKHLTFKIDHSMMKKMLSFSSWTIFGNLGYILHTQGIAIIINIYFTVAVNAAQGIANQVNGLVTQFATNFLIALNPQIVKTYAAGELNQMHSLIIRGCKMAFCLISFFAIPLVLETPMVLKIWLGIVPDYSVLFTRLTLLITLINSFSSLLTTSKGATGNIKNYELVLTFIGVFHLPLAWLAFKIGYGPEYSMYVYFIISIILQFFRIVFVCKGVKLELSIFFKEVVLRCIFVFLSSSILPTLLHIILSPSLLTTIIVTVISILNVIISTLYVALTKYERKVIINTIISKINKKNIYA